MKTLIIAAGAIVGSLLAIADTECYVGMSDAVVMPSACTNSFPMVLTYSPLDGESLRVAIDGEEILESSAAGTYEWLPETGGLYTLTHKVGETLWTTCIVVNCSVVGDRKHLGVIVKPAVEATSASAGSTAEIRCSRCGELMQASEEVSALGYIRNVTTRILSPCNKIEVSYELAEDIGEVVDRETCVSWTNAFTVVPTLSGVSYRSEGVVYYLPWNPARTTVCDAGRIRFQWRLFRDDASENGSLKFWVDGILQRNMYWTNWVDGVDRIFGVACYAPDRVHPDYGWSIEDTVLYPCGSADYATEFSNTEEVELSPGLTHDLKWEFEGTSRGVVWGVTALDISSDWYTTGNTVAEPGLHRVVIDFDKINSEDDVIALGMKYGDLFTEIDDVHTHECKFMDGMTISGLSELCYSTLDNLSASIYIDNELLIKASDCGSFLWQPKSLGEHVIEHISGTNVWTRTVNVTQLDFVTHKEPNPTCEPDETVSLPNEQKDFTSAIRSPGSFAVSSTVEGKAWNASASDDWISLTKTNGVCGVNSVTYYVGINTNAAERTGYIYVNGHVYTIVQPGVGAALAVADPLVFDCDGTTQTVTVEAAEGVQWNVRPGAEWITIQPTSGCGTGTVTLCAAPFVCVGSRSGIATIAGNVVTFTQNGCDMQLTHYSTNCAQSATSLSVGVMAKDGFAWSVVTQVDWISASSSLSGNGDGDVILSISNNEGQQTRTGVVKIGTESFKIVQEPSAPCLSTTQIECAPDVAEVTVDVRVDTYDRWSISNDIGWIAYDVAESLIGPRQVTLYVDANTNTISRTGKLMIAGFEVVVIQSAAVVSLSQAESNVGHGGGEISISVAAPDYLNWVVDSMPAWVVLSGESSRVGSGQLLFAVSQNSTTDNRECEVKVGGRTLLIRQAAAQAMVSADRNVHGRDAEFGEIVVTAEGYLNWDATTTNGWIEFTGATSYTGSGTVEYIVGDIGIHESRIGVVWLGRTPVYVCQSGFATTLDVTEKTVPRVSGNGRIAVTVDDSADEWCSVSTVPWISVLTASGIGNGMVQYSYEDNTTGVERVGRILVGDQVFTLTQTTDNSDVPRWTISYENLHGVEHANPSQYNAGDVLTFVSPSAGRVGYSFGGWNPAGITADTVGDITVQAVWNIETYNITYDLRGGENVAENPVSYTVEDEIVLQPPKRDGYLFLGWVPDDGVSRGSVGDRSFVADWTKLHELNLDANGGTVEWEPVSVTNGFPVSDLAVPIRDGYDFRGWYTSSVGGDEITSVTSNITLYAHWRDRSIIEISEGWYQVAEGGCNWKFKYESADRVKLCGCDPMPSGIVKIPASVGGFAVIKLGYGLFENAQNVTGVIVPEGVVEIGGCAFHDDEIQNVFIPSSVKNFGGVLAYHDDGEVTWVMSGEEISYASSAFDSWGCSFNIIALNGVPPGMVVPTGMSNNARFRCKREYYDAWRACLGDSAIFVEYLDDDVEATSAFDIELNPQGGAVEQLICKARLGEPMEGLPTPTRTGYVFVGWYSAPVGGRTFTLVEGNMKLYAHWRDATTIEVGSASYPYEGSIFRASIDGREWNYMIGSEDEGESYVIVGNGEEGGAFEDAQNGSVNVVIPSAIEYLPVRKIARYAFYNKTGIESLSIPDGVDELAFFSLCISRWDSPEFTSVRFLCNAPLCSDSIGLEYSGATVYVPYGSTGWDGNANSTNLPSTWDSRPIKWWGEIHFDANGGDCEESVRYYHDDDLMGALPNVTPPDGFYVDGWYTAVDGGVKISATDPIPGPVTLFAHYVQAPSIYDISFVSGVEGLTVPSIQRTGGEALGTLPQLVRDGYILLGWYSSLEGGAKVTESDVALGDTTLYARWIYAPYSITYLNTMGAANTNAVGYSVDDEIVFAPLGGITNYEFNGWTPSSIERGTIGDMAVTASWRWAPQTAIVEASITGDRSMVVNAGWVTNDLIRCFGEGKDAAFRNAYGADLAAALTKPTGKYDGDGNELSVWHDYVAGTDPTDSNSVFSASITMKDGVPVIEWSPNLNSNGEERVYTIYGKTNLTDAVWRTPTNECSRFFKVDVAMPPEGTVTFNLGGAGGSIDSSSIRIGQPIGDLPTPTRSNYQFIGWFTEEEGGTEITAETIVTADITIYAHWKSNDLVHRWSFNGDLTDSVGGQTATAVGSAVSSSSTQYTLSGVGNGSGYISLGSNILPNDGSPVTMEIWTTYNAASSFSRIWSIDTVVDNNCSDELCMGWTAGAGYLIIRGANNKYDDSVLGTYSTGTQYHLAVVFEPVSDGSWNVTAYKQDTNGNTLSKTTLSTYGTSWSLTTQPQDYCNLGHTHGGSECDANASYNELRVWKKAMTEAELTASAIAGPDAGLE